MKNLLLTCFIFLAGSAMSQDKRQTPIEFYNLANYENLEQSCRDFYAEDIQFVDPLGKINGLDNMIKYYKNLYENVTSIEFEEINTFIKGDEEVLVWRMHMSHKKVNSGNAMTLDGVSVFRYSNNRVVYHRDYFDLGEMLYEKVPVLGGLIKWIKEKAHGQ